MTSRIDRRFAACRAEGRAALVTFVMGGDPDPATSLDLVKALPNLQEVSIGHAVIADAMMFGLGETVRKFRTAIGDL